MTSRSRQKSIHNKIDLILDYYPSKNKVKEAEEYIQRNIENIAGNLSKLNKHLEKYGIIIYIEKNILKYRFKLKPVSTSSMGTNKITTNAPVFVQYFNELRLGKGRKPKRKTKRKIKRKSKKKID
jgi:hypothetical protein